MSRVLFDADTHALPLIHDRAAVLAVTQAACTLMSGQPDLSPHEAVGDVLQVQKYVEDLLLNMRPDRFFPYGGQGAPSA